MRIDEVINARIEDIYRFRETHHGDHYHIDNSYLPNRFTYKGGRYTLVDVGDEEYESKSDYWYYGANYYQLHKGTEPLPYYWKQEWKSYWGYAWCPQANDEISQEVVFLKQPVQTTEEEATDEH